MQWQALELKCRAEGFVTPPTLVHLLGVKRTWQLTAQVN